jgi:hypothetical protein
LDEAPSANPSPSNAATNCKQSKNDFDYSRSHQEKGNDSKSSMNSSLWQGCAIKYTLQLTLMTPAKIHGYVFSSQKVMHVKTNLNWRSRPSLMLLESIDGNK